MARKELGHIELQWQCPNCDGINPGREKTCQRCGAPQPDDVEFKQFARQELLTDEKLIAQAKAGADIHCAYCGTRNPATAKVCSQCGSDISEGTQREAGRVVGAFQTGPGEDVKCPACGTLNPDTALSCTNCGASLAKTKEKEPAIAKPAQPKGRRKFPVILVIVFGLICISAVVIAILSGKTKAIEGVVESVHWERSISIEAFVPVEYSDWYDMLHSDAENISCEYQVYDDYCSYTVMEWAAVDTAVISGNDLYPAWPDPNLTNDQRLGDNRSETYNVIFNADGETYSYTPDSLNDFQRFEIGNSWNLNVNTFGVVVSVDR
jgi:ribosomal protein L40E